MCATSGVAMIVFASLAAAIGGLFGFCILPCLVGGKGWDSAVPSGPISDSVEMKRFDRGGNGTSLRDSILYVGMWTGCHVCWLPASPHEPHLNWSGDHSHPHCHCSHGSLKWRAAQVSEEKRSSAILAGV
jgi:hypothetical protein